MEMLLIYRDMFERDHKNGKTEVSEFRCCGKNCDNKQNCVPCEKCVNIGKKIAEMGWF